MRRLSSILIAAAAILVAACGQKNTVEGSLDELFHGLFASDAPGALVIVEKDGKIVYDKGFGLANLETGAPITDTTMFNICSVSKQFSAMALFILAEEGKISLDDPVNKYFPQFKAEFFGRITLRNLISHTSGLPDSRPRTEKEIGRAHV